MEMVEKIEVEQAFAWLAYHQDVQRAQNVKIDA